MTANYKLKSHKSLRTYTLPRPLIRDGKKVIYDNALQSQITLFTEHMRELNEQQVQCPQRRLLLRATKIKGTKDGPSSVEL